MPQYSIYVLVDTIHEFNVAACSMHLQESELRDGHLRRPDDWDTSQAKPAKEPRSSEVDGSSLEGGMGWIFALLCSPM